MSSIPQSTAFRALCRAAFFLGISASSLVNAATSVAHSGITWTFSSDRPTGTFANGEPWVVGPVTVTGITPNPGQSTSGVQHGSMKNPVAGTKNGFTNEADGSNLLTAVRYDATKNVALNLPLNLAAGDVLASSKTGYDGRNYMETVCVLTVLASAPPAGSFRPGPYGSSHPVRFNKSQINWNILKNFAPVTGTPTKAQIEAKLPALPWWEWSENYSGNLLCPWRNMAAGNDGQGIPSTYGREIANKWGEIALWLNLNHPQADKEKVMIQTIQCGIDIASYLKNGGGFYHDGGHKCGRKIPLLIAAVALNDSELLALAKNPDIFQEDTQTWIVTQSDVGRSVVSPKETYTQSNVGMAEWGVRHRYEPNQDDSRWVGPAYRNVVWPSMAGPVLAAELMGLKTQWGHPAIFAYTERYKSIAGLGGFAGNMWSAYKGAATTPPPGVTVSTPTFSPSPGSYPQAQNVTIATSSSGASIRYTTNGTNPTRTTGIVYSGPVTMGVGVTTLKAIAYNGTDSDSAVVTGTYTIASSTAPVPPSNLRVVE